MTFFAFLPGHAIVAGALLLLTRRIKPEKVYREIDWPMLVMFAAFWLIGLPLGALIGITVDKDTDLVISTNIEAAKSRRARSLGIPVIHSNQLT